MTVFELLVEALICDEAKFGVESAVSNWVINSAPEFPFNLSGRLNFCQLLK